MSEVRDLATALRQAAERGHIPWDRDPDDLWKAWGIESIPWAMWREVGWWGPIDPWLQSHQATRMIHINPDGMLRVVGKLPVIGDTGIHPRWVTWVQHRCLSEAGLLNPIEPDRWLIDGREVYVVETSFLDSANRRRIRISMTKPPYTPDGPSITMRCIQSVGWTLDDLVRQGTISAESKAMLITMIERHCTIIVGGSTGSGKTTFISGLLHVANDLERRMIVIEDTRELPTPVNGLCVDANTHPDRFRGCLRHALRQDPDMIVVGEIRGDEAMTVLEAASSGHPALATVHATGPSRIVGRLIELAIGRSGAPADYVHQTIVGGSFPLIIVYMHDRKVMEITEIMARANSRAGEAIPMNPLFVRRGADGLVPQYPPQGPWFYHGG